MHSSSFRAEMLGKRSSLVGINHVTEFGFSVETFEGREHFTPKFPPHEFTCKNTCQFTEFLKNETCRSGEIRDSEYRKFHLQARMNCLVFLQSMRCIRIPSINRCFS